MAADRTPGDFGSKLREARERRGVSLRQIANSTKISVAALEALERNNISRLPGGIFSRSFVRSYALEVGLDPEEAIREFLAQFPHDSVTVGHRSSEHVEDNEAIESNRRLAVTLLRLTAVSIPIAGLIIYFGIAGRRATSPAQQPPPPAAEAFEPLPALTATPSAPNAALVPDEPVAERLTVVLSVSRICWISATVDGGRAIEWLLQAGEQQTIDVERELVLTAGDAGALTVTVNGTEARPLGMSGEVATVRLNLTNFKEYLRVQ